MQDHPRLTEFARSLRREMTPAEKTLWKQLRGRRFAALKFRRQVPHEPYILDFYCRQMSLVVELDGDSHVGKEEHDGARQRALEGQGIRVLRFLNSDVYEDLDVVLEAIWRACVSGSGGDSK